MNILPSLITETSVILLKGNKRLSATVGHPMFHKIVEKIKSREYANIERLFSAKEAIESLFNIKIKNGSEVFYKGSKVHNTLTVKILGCIRRGEPHKPWVNFLNKLMENPSEHCRNQLFDYVNRYGLPIDDQGFIYGWKVVNSDFWDKHTGRTHCYKVGSVIKKARESCEENPTVGCGAGLHCGEASYVLQYSNSSDDRFILVRFSPKDVISCPEDCSWQKLRLCKLRVMREVKRFDIVPLQDSSMGKKGKLPRRNNLGQFC